jgi:rubrerythrin
MIILMRLLVKDREKMEKQQRLYELLKQQHEAEKDEIIHYSTLLKEIENNLIRNYINTLLTDGIKHIQYITQAMAKIEGASGSVHLTTEGINQSIEEEEESKNLLLECIDLTQDKDVKELLNSVVVDEEHHIKILEHIGKLVESYSKKIL